MFVSKWTGLKIQGTWLTSFPCVFISLLNKMISSSQLGLWKEMYTIIPLNVKTRQPRSNIFPTSLVWFAQKRKDIYQLVSTNIVYNWFFYKQVRFQFILLLSLNLFTTSFDSLYRMRRLMNWCWFQCKASIDTDCIFLLYACFMVHISADLSSHLTMCFCCL